MNGKKRKYKPARIAGLICVVLLFLILCVLTAAAFRPFALLPQGANWQLTPVEKNLMPASLPQGALAVVDRVRTPHESEMVAYQAEEGIVFGRVAKEEEDGYTLQTEKSDDTVQIKRSDLYGAVPYYIGGLGKVILLMHEFRLTMVAACALYFVFWIVFIATAPARRRARRKKELMELFEFYGEKYDIEEAGIDY